MPQPTVQMTIDEVMPVDDSPTVEIDLNNDNLGEFLQNLLSDVSDKSVKAFNECLCVIGVYGNIVKFGILERYARYIEQDLIHHELKQLLQVTLRCVYEDVSIQAEIEIIDNGEITDEDIANYNSDAPPVEVEPIGYEDAVIDDEVIEQQGVSIFNFDQNKIRTVVDDSGEIWFVAKDVAKSLGYIDTTNAIKQHCKGVVNYHPLQTDGGTQEIRVIKEPDVLRLIMKSKLPAAEAFEKWVFEEVLPALRKTGKYEIPKVEPKPKENLIEKFQEANAVIDWGR